jgi:hypothetical protein
MIVHDTDHLFVGVHPLAGFQKKSNPENDRMSHVKTSTDRLGPR